MNNDIDRLVERTLAYGRRGQHLIRESLRRERVVRGVFGLIVDCPRELTDKWEREGFRVQGFSFREGEAAGKLLQIGLHNDSKGRRALRVFGGQDLAVCVKLVRTGDDMKVVVEGGKWLDKVFSGVLAWSFFVPLLSIPASGAYRQRKLIVQAEEDVLDWLENHRKPSMETIDVLTW